MNETLLLGITGSTAYGLNTPQSDVDRIGVFAAPPEQFLGMNFNPDKMTKTTKDPDLTMHELSKFLNLYTKCNPTIVELLFLESYDELDERLSVLLSQRASMLNSEGVRKSYGGYALAQAKRLQNRLESGKKGFNSDLAKRTQKHGRHCFRLMLQAEQLLTTGEMVVNVGDKRDFLFEVGELAEKNVDKFVELFEKEVQKLDTMESVLPASNNGFEIANNFLINFRKNYLV